MKTKIEWLDMMEKTSDYKCYTLGNMLTACKEKGLNDWTIEDLDACQEAYN